MSDRKEITINKNEEKNKKKKKGVVIGVIGLAVAAAIATPLALKGCAPNEKSFTVTFLTDEEVQGFQQGSMNVKEGTTVGKLKDQLAPLDGYDFEGFFKDEACQQPFDDNEVVNDDTIIYIQYSEIQITVKFHGEVSDGEKPDAETFTIGYFDKISDFADQIPTRTKEGTIGIDYVFAYWETLDHKKVDLNELIEKLKTGKELYDIDPDRELDLYAYFESKYVEYSLTIPNKVTVMKGNQKLTSSDTVHYNDELTIIYSGVELPEEWIASFYVNGAYETEESKYKVTGDVTIEVKEVQHRYLTFSDDHKTVTGMNKNSTETNIIIPTVYYDGTGVTNVASGSFKNNINIVSVVIGDRVTHVGREVFSNCSNLKEITVGKKVISFDRDTFLDCSVLETVTYVGTIDEWVQIKFASAKSNPLFYQAKKFYVEKNKAVEGEVKINTSIASTAFRGYKGEFSVILGDGVESIGSNAFIACRNLTSVVIGKNVTSIDMEAFRDCIGLVNVTMGDGLTSIGDGVFQNCTSLKNVVVGKSVTSLGVSAFYECTGLVSVTLGESVKTIANTAFAGCTALESIVVGKSVTSFGTDAFLDCALLKTVTYTGTIDQWVKITFNSAKANPLFNAAEKFYVENNKAVEGVVTINTSINNTAFRGYKGSFSLVLGDGAKTIGDNVFINCTGLTSVIIGKNVTSIGKEAFRDCTGLERVIIGKNVTTLGSNVFGNCPAFDSIYFSGSESEFNSWSLKSNAVLGASSNNVYYYSAGNPYENGTATTGLTYWHYASDGVTPEVWEAIYEIGEIPHGITIYKGENASGTKINKGDKVEYGTKITIHYDLDEDYIFGSLTINGKSYSENQNNITIEVVGKFTITFEQVYNIFTLSFDENKFLVKDAQGNPLQSGVSRVHGGDIITIEGVTVQGDWVYGISSISGASLKSGTTYTVTGNVSIEAGEVEHRYLILTLLDSGTYEVTGMKSGSTETNIVIPANHYDGKAITSIAGGSTSTGAFYNKKTITELTIGENITTINRYAFYNCTALTKIEWDAVNVTDFDSGNYVFAYAGTNGDGIEVVFGDNVQNIPAYCFDPYIKSYAPKITSVVMGNSVTRIGTYAFNNCSSLASVDFLGSIDDWASISFGNSNSNPCEYSKSLKIKGQLISEETINVDISAYAFYYVENLTKITIAENVKSIGSSAFYGCSGLTELTIGENVTIIKNYAFNNCTALTKIVWNAVNVTDFVSSNYVFSKAGQDGDGVEVIFGDSVESIPAYCFYPYATSSNDSTYVPKITSVVIGNSVTLIGTYAFTNCESLTSIVIGNSVTNVETRAFYNCRGLTSVDYLGSIDQWARISFDGYYSNPCYYSKSLKIKGELITEVTIDVDINKYVFYYVQNLTKVTLTENVTSIGSSAFYGCSGLTELTIGENVTIINNSAFYNCTALTKITWNAANVEDFNYQNSIFSYAGQAGNGIEVIFGDSVESIPAYCFYPYYLTSITPVSEYSPNITSVVIGENVTSIGDHAFYRCTSLTIITWNAINVADFDSQNYVFNYAGTEGDGIQVIIGKNVEHIPAYCFCPYYSTSTYPVGIKSPKITSVVIGENVTSIGDYAFYRCDNLAEVDYLGSVDDWVSITFVGHIYANPCYYSKSLKIKGELISEVTINTDIKFAAFYNVQNLIKVTLGDSVTSIKKSAFYECSNLTTITIPESVTNISSYVFYNCSSLTGVVIPNRVTSIGEYTFYGCSGLISVTIGNGVTSIGDNAFSGCSSLTTLTIGEGVTSIGNRAFNNCTALTRIEWNAVNVSGLGEQNYVFFNAGKSGTGIEVIFGDKVENIPAYCFYPYDSLSYAPKITNVIIGENVTSIGSYAFYECRNLTSVDFLGTVDQWANIIFSSIRANPCYYSQSLKIKGELIREVTINVETINAYAFYNVQNLKKVTIGENVTSIGNYAFYCCIGLTTLTIGEGVTNIGNSAFSSCSSLTGELVIPNSVTSIGDYTFAYCGDLETVVIGKNVTRIGSYAFYNCGDLATVVIGKNVTSIENYAFYYCSKLKKVYYGGTSEEWIELEKNIDSSNTSLSSATIYYFSEQNPFEGEGAATSGNYWHWGEPDESGVKKPVVWKKQ